jgi:hypothetical protein
MLTIPSQSHATITRAHEPVVLVAGRPCRDLRVLRIHQRPAPHFDTAEVELAPSHSTARAQQLHRLPAVGSAVRIEAAGFVLAGYVEAHESRIDDGGEHLVAHVRHQLTRLLAAPVRDLWRDDAGSARRVGDGEVVFNASDDALASPCWHTIAGRQAPVFSCAAGAKAWTVADALAYLLATAVGPDVSVPSPSELGPLAGEIDLGRLNVAAMPAAEALAKVAAIAGLALRAAASDAPAIIIYRPGSSAARRTLQLQPAGQKLDPARSNLWRGRLSITRRPGRPNLVLLGGRKVYETTVELAPGWDPATSTTRWRDTVRSLADNWLARGETFRKWVLNEHGRYGRSPWNLPAADLSHLGDGDFAAPLPRQLRPCLSTGPDGRSLGIVVETSLVGGPWKRWRGPLWVARDEASVFLGGDALGGEFFAAAVAGQARVRVTASIESDAPLSLEVPGDAALGTEVVDESGRAAWRQVHPSSVLAGADGTGEPLVRDDAPLLFRIAARMSQPIAAAVEGTATLAAIDTSWRLGDAVDRVCGRGLEIASRVDARPAVTAIVHDLAAQTTTLNLRG